MYPFPEDSKVNKATRTQIIDSFRRLGWSHHSANAINLGVILRYCEENEIEYRLHAWPGRGYAVEAVNFTDGEPLREMPPAGKGLDDGPALAALDKLNSLKLSRFRADC